MSKLAVEFYFTGSTTSGYDSSKTSLGPLMWQNSGANPSDKWVGPYPIQMGRPMEASTAIPCMYPCAVPYSPNYDYIFFADNAAAAATRRLVLYQYNKPTQNFSYIGFVPLVYTNTTAHTIRGFRMAYYTHSVGHCQVTGSAVTMSNEGNIYTHSFATGSRIGFGTTIPYEIDNWYQIAQISGNGTSITLQTPYTGTAFSGTFVAEEFRALTLNTNATLASGGLYLVKGLNPGIFNVLGTNVIPPATGADNIRATYWLLDSASLNNGTGSGLAMGQCTADLSTHSVYALDGATTVLKVYKYNIRAPLTNLVQGKTTSSFMYNTATQSVTGNISQLNNSRYGTLAHGPGSGSPAIYFCTTNRIYRMDETLITSNSLNSISDTMMEIPPGGVSTFAAGSVFAAVEIMSNIDRLIVGTTNATSLRSYITKYRTDSGQMDHIIGLDIKQLDQSIADSDIVPMPFNNIIGTLSFWSEGGILYVSRNTAVATTNQVYTIPLSADWQYAANTGCRIITPAISTPGATKFYSIYFDDATWLGGIGLGMPTEPCRIYARTAGISDNSGAWTLFNRAGDLDTFNGSDTIQFMFEFRTIGLTCIPDRIYSLTVLYESPDTDSHYTPSTGKSIVASRIFAWRQATSWGSNIPNMQINLFNVATEINILNDTTDLHTLGTWEYSLNGTDWFAWDNTKDTIGNYIRYTADSLPDGTTIRAVLSQV